MKNIPNNHKFAVLADMSGLMRRQYHAMTSSGAHLNQESHYNGHPTFMVLPAISLLLREINVTAKHHNTTTDYVAAIFDHPGECFRHEIFPEYKANRPQAPEDYTFQVNLIRQILQRMGVCCISKPGVEADDVIGTLTTKMQPYPICCSILCRDKDAFSKINEKTTIYSGADKKHFTIENMQEKIPVPPSKVADYLALNGDSTDGIPGVPGFGPKMATLALEQYSLEELTSNPSVLNEIKGMTGAKSKIEWLTENPDLALTYKKLTTLKDDVSIGMSLMSLTYQPDLENPAQHLREIIGER